MHIGTHCFAGWLVAVGPKGILRRYHHILGRNLGFALAVTASVALLERLATDLERPWTLSSWQNSSFTAVLLVAMVWVAWTFGRSPLSVFSDKGYAAFVATLRHRFGTPVS